jgi:hypothetical protein
MKIIGNKQVAPVGRLAAAEHPSGTAGALADGRILGILAPRKSIPPRLFR